jgi:hypothetical protein
VNLTPEAILALIATAGVGIAFLLMLEEAIALKQGRDPMSNGVRAFVRRFPRGNLRARGPDRDGAGPPALALTRAR